MVCYFPLGYPIFLMLGIPFVSLFWWRDLNCPHGRHLGAACKIVLFGEGLPGTYSAPMQNQWKQIPVDNFMASSERNWANSWHLWSVVRQIPGIIGTQSGKFLVSSEHTRALSWHPRSIPMQFPGILGAYQVKLLASWEHTWSVS